MITNCTFTTNSAGFGGGGIYCAGEATISYCTITGNSATGTGDYEGGGGIYCDGEIRDATISHCTIKGNSGNSGGGIYCVGNSQNTVISHCIINDNSATGTGVYDGGGGIFFDMSMAAITNCVITGNSANQGGGICDYWYSEPTVRHCTITANLANKGGGYYDESVLCAGTVSHCILWGNTAGGGSEIEGWEPPVVLYSDIEGGYSGTNNIDTDPCFADAANGDYHLKSQAGRWDPNNQTWLQDTVTSPAIDAGNPNSPIGYEPFPNGGVINMGAYGGTAEASKSYFGGPVCETIVAGDINGDCKVDFRDFALMALHWLEDNNP